MEQTKRYYVRQKVGEMARRRNKCSRNSVDKTAVGEMVNC